MSGAAGLVLQWVAAEIVPALIVDVTARSIQRIAEGSHTRFATRREFPDGAETEPQLHLVSSTRVLSAAGGRVRLEVVGLKGEPRRAAEIDTVLARVRGITLANASWVTGNVLVAFDPGTTSIDAIRDAIDPRSRVTPKRDRMKRSEANSIQLALGLN